MAEPLRKRGRRSRGGGTGRGARGARAGRGRHPGAQRSQVQRTLDSVLVDLVSDSDEEILEVKEACAPADPVETPPPQPPAPPARSHSDSDSEGADVRPDGAPRAVVRRRRRLLLDPGEAPVVPVYSAKVRPGGILASLGVSLFLTERGARRGCSCLSAHVTVLQEPGSSPRSPPAGEKPGCRCLSVLV